jgi:hypothetical protein
LARCGASCRVVHQASPKPRPGRRRLSGEKEQTRVRAHDDGDERLLAQERHRRGYFEEVQAAALGEAPEAYRPRLVAGRAIGAVAALLSHEQPADRLDERLELVAVFLDGGLRAITGFDGTN